MDFYCVAGPLLRRLDPEVAHRLAIAALERGLVPRPPRIAEDVLRVRLWGMDFPNPVGLAAGFDKDGRVPDAMLDQGFGFVEVGSITPKPQPGNPRPRVFRLVEDRAVINRLGMNSDGHTAVARRLSARARRGIVGVNLGMNKDTPDPVADFATGVRLFADIADYLVVNVSSPNTPGVRAMQGAAPLRALLDAARAALATATRQPPLLVKIAPDLTDEDKEDIAGVCLEKKVDGMIVGNTTVRRPESLRSKHRGEAGGLSGRPLYEPSTRVLGEMYRRTGGRLPLIGVGGITSGRDAMGKIVAGASLVQLYTAMIYQGPGVAARIARELAEILRAHGVHHLAAAVGSGTGSF